MPESALRRIAGGDATAVQECLDRHGGLVWALARRFCADRADAEDAVQEIFIDLWASAGRFDPDRASEATFVAMIARRRLIDGRRKAARRPPAGPLPDGLVGREVDAATRAERGDDVDRAALALAGLGDEQRRVLAMAIYEGRTQEQIARATGLPLGTVKTHARRGLMKLRQSLGARPGLAAKGGLP